MDGWRDGWRSTNSSPLARDAYSKTVTGRFQMRPCAMPLDAAMMNALSMKDSDKATPTTTTTTVEKVAPMAEGRSNRQTDSQGPDREDLPLTRVAS